MNNLLLRFLCVGTFFLYFLGMMGCASNKANEVKKSMPVRWTEFFTMPSILASSDFPLNSVNDLPSLIDAQWYSEIEAINTKAGNYVFTSCKDYFDKAKPTTHTLKDNEMTAYLEFKIMCEATKILMNAKKSEESFLPNVLLNNETPKNWPKEIAPQISTEESMRILGDTSMSTWADVTTIVKVKNYSGTKSTYFYDGGYQNIEILGYGDSNNDSIEDVFIIVRDHVSGGNYFNIRLFILSVTPRGKWEILKRF